MDEATNGPGQQVEDVGRNGESGGSLVGRAERIFRESPYHQLRSVKCEYCDGVLSLHGQLPSFFLKQQAQSIVQRLDANVRLDNQIEVN